MIAQRPQAGSGADLTAPSDRLKPCLNGEMTATAGIPAIRVSSQAQLPSSSCSFSARGSQPKSVSIQQPCWTAADGSYMGTRPAQLQCVPVLRLTSYFLPGVLDPVEPLAEACLARLHNFHTPVWP